MHSPSPALESGARLAFSILSRMTQSFMGLRTTMEGIHPETGSPAECRRQLPVFSPKRNMVGLLSETSGLLRLPAGMLLAVLPYVPLTWVHESGVVLACAA